MKLRGAICVAALQLHGQHFCATPGRTLGASDGHNLGTILFSGDSAQRRPTANPRELSARGGSRTHTELSLQGILSPSRLPFRHPGLVDTFTFRSRQNLLTGAFHAVGIVAACRHFDHSAISLGLRVDSARQPRREKPLCLTSNRFPAACRSVQETDCRISKPLGLDGGGV